MILTHMREVPLQDHTGYGAGSSREPFSSKFFSCVQLRVEEVRLL